MEICSLFLDAFKGLLRLIQGHPCGPGPWCFLASSSKEPVGAFVSLSILAVSVVHGYKAHHVWDDWVHNDLLMTSDQRMDVRDMKAFKEGMFDSVLDKGAA